jgi:hypothetical protein
MDIKQEGDKMVITINCEIYRNNRREPKLIRKVYDINNIIDEIHLNSPSYSIRDYENIPNGLKRFDNKFNTPPAIFVLQKKKKKYSRPTTVDENPTIILDEGENEKNKVKRRRIVRPNVENNNLSIDKDEKPVLKSSKRRRRKSRNTVE